MLTLMSTRQRFHAQGAVKRMWIASDWSYKRPGSLPSNLKLGLAGFISRGGKGGLLFPLGFVLPPPPLEYECVVMKSKLEKSLNQY